MRDVPGMSGIKVVRPNRGDRLGRAIAARGAVAPVEIGAQVLDVERLKKHIASPPARCSASGRPGRSRRSKTSFAAREAEVLAIVGESGCGKSTLAKVLLGLETASEGWVIFDNEAIQNQPIEGAPPRQSRRSR